jgi:F-box and leucine-rich repeat protein 2/20
LDIDIPYHVKDEHVVELSSYMGNLLSLNLNSCLTLIISALFSLVRNCPSLSEIKMEFASIGKESLGHFDSLVEFDVYPKLKSLYLVLNAWLSDVRKRGIHG